MLIKGIVMTNEKSKSNNIFQITINLTVASLISGLVIAGVYFITEPYAVKQRLKYKNQSMKELVESASDFRQIKEKEDWFEALNDGKTIAYVISTEGRGYGGAIKIMVAVDNDDRIIGYKILSHNETPGLGDQTESPKFKKQFKGKKIDTLEITKNHEPGKIDAITGATISSTAVTKAIKEGLVNLGEYIKR